MATRAMLVVAALSTGGAGALALAPASAEETPAKAPKKEDGALDRGIRWLVAHQNADGSWTGTVGFKLNDEYKVEADAKPHVAVTALAGLALLAHEGPGKRGDDETKALKRAGEFVLGCAHPDSGLIEKNGTRVYGHALATLFLAEAKGRLALEGIDAKLAKAVTALVDGQNEAGGWRYELGAAESDVSVTACALEALGAAKRKGVEVPESTFERARKLLDELYVDMGDDARAFLASDGYYFLRDGAFAYQPQEASRSSYALTAAGLSAEQQCGRSHTDFPKSVQLLDDAYSLIRERPEHYFYWYSHLHAVQAMRSVGGEPWKRWSDHVRGEIAKLASDDGSWKNSTGPGDAFATAIACLVLQADRGGLSILGDSRGVEKK